jgi:septum formation protein
MKLILASKSPRRKELLGSVLKNTSLNITTDIISADIDESNLPGEEPLEYAKRLAKEKGIAVAKEIYKNHSKKAEKNFLILSADTIVVHHNKVYGKPIDNKNAIAILSELNGNQHSVITAFTFIRLTLPNDAADPSQNKFSNCLIETTSDHDCTEVTFKKLTLKMISDYVATGDPMDKAGAYGIQGPAQAFVADIKGSFNNVVGLPTEKITQVLKKFYTQS